jgi:hypothetical protein
MHAIRRKKIRALRIVGYLPFLILQVLHFVHFIPQLWRRSADIPVTSGVPIEFQSQERVGR